MKQKLTCMTAGCSSAVYWKGHCRPHIAPFGKLIKNKVTSWEKLEKDGLVLASTKPKTGGQKKAVPPTHSVLDAKVMGELKPLVQQLKDSVTPDEILDGLVELNSKLATATKEETAGELHEPELNVETLAPKKTNKVFQYGLKNGKTGVLNREAIGHNPTEAAESIGWNPKDVVRAYPIRVVG